ncbi:hypothetical protein N7475_005150 [Penicillium sp. IBT 31633x]|nr:hypothetical protein N7475_005150 [Penicillium sp. IBT 31633x]
MGALRLRHWAVPSHVVRGVRQQRKFTFRQTRSSQAEITLEQAVNNLKSVPDHEVYTEWLSSETTLMQAPTTLIEETFIKRPNPQMYEILKDHKALPQLSSPLFAEAEMLQSLSQNPHPNIIRYHGCRVLRGYFIGLVLEKHPHDLYTYLEKQVGTINKTAFINALKSALSHLHAQGLAHNDLSPHNVLVSQDGMPVLIDFQYIRGHHKWIDGKIKDYTTSTQEHDLSALVKIVAWIDKPVFDE